MGWLENTHLDTGVFRAAIKFVAIILTLHITNNTIRANNSLPKLAKFQYKMYMVDIFALLIPFNLQDLPHVFSGDHLLQKLEQYYKRDNNGTLTPTYASTPIDSRTLFHSTPYSLPFDQDSAIIIFQAQNKLNEFFKVEFLFVAAGVKSREQNILNHYAKIWALP